MFVVIENTPGYLPDNCDPLVTDDYSEAVAEVNRLADELEEQGYVVDRSLASENNMYCCFATDPERTHDLGRWISVEIDEDEPIDL